VSDPFPPNPGSPSRKFFEAIDAYANILAVAGSLGVVGGFALWFFTVLPMIGLGVMMFSLGALCVCMIGHLSVSSAEPILSLGRLTHDDTQKALLLNSASTLKRSVAPPSTFDHKFKIHEPFRKAYNEHKDILGQPKGEAEPLQHAYLAQYDKVQVIWNENAGEFYRLHMRDDTWVSAKDLLDDDPSWYDDMKNRERFGIPQGQLPPWGGPARLRAVNRKDWSIGSRQWHFYHIDGATSVQRFEKGLIVGPFRRFWGDKDAQVYALTGEGTDRPKWYTSLLIGVSDLDCVEPMELAPVPKAAPERLSDKTKEVTNCA
jgi:hypothetical protein